MLKRIADFQGFEGHVDIEFGKYRQRMSEISNLSLSFNEEGKVDTKTVNLAQEGLKLYDLIHSKVKEVNLKHIESGKEFKNLDDLEDYKEYIDVMAKLIETYNAGQSLGNA